MMKRDILLVILISLVVYNAVPLINLLFPASVLYWFARFSSVENTASNFGFPL